MPFGKGGRQAIGIVVGPGAPVAAGGPEIRPIAARVRSDGPLLPPLSLRFAAVVADRYLAPLATVIRAMLPPGMLERLELVAEVTPAGETRLGQAKPDLPAVELDLLDELAGRPRPVRDLSTPEGRAALLRRLRSLADAGLVDLTWTLPRPRPSRSSSRPSSGATRPPRCSTALPGPARPRSTRRCLRPSLASRPARPHAGAGDRAGDAASSSRLPGPSSRRGGGSCFIRAMGRGRARRRLAARPGRLRRHRRRNTARGPRPPSRSFGVVIVDEEHDAAYKSDRTPRIQARDLAVCLGRLAGACVILGSATPSVETMGRALRGRAGAALTLPERTAGALPTDRGSSTCARSWPGAIAGSSPGGWQKLLGRPRPGSRRGRSILVINRRGAASAVLCRDCGGVLTLPRNAPVRSSTTTPA